MRHIVADRLVFNLLANGDCYTIHEIVIILRSRGYRGVIEEDVIDALTRMNNPPWRRLVVARKENPMDKEYKYCLVHGGETK